MTQNLNKTTLTTNSSTWSSPISHSIVSTGTNFTTTGVSYASHTAISNPLYVNGPIVHNNEEGKYSQSYLHEVAVIAITRSPEGHIIRSKMVKTMWVETKHGGSIDFAAGKDPEVGNFEPEDIIIKTLRTIKL